MSAPPQKIRVNGHAYVLAASESYFTSPMSVGLNSSMMDFGDILETSLSRYIRHEGLDKEEAAKLAMRDAMSEFDRALRMQSVDAREGLETYLQGIVERWGTGE